MPSNAKTLIDSIFSNIISLKAIYGNLIPTISFHLSTDYESHKHILQYPPFNTVSQIFLKETDKILIKKVLYLIA